MLELNRIYNEDCYLGIKKIESKSIDLIVTDPPYDFKGKSGGGAFGTKNRKYHDLVSANELLNCGITEELLREFVRVMKRINVYIFCNKNQIRFYLDFFCDLNCSFDLLCWHKTNPVPTCNNKYLSDTEYILWFREKGVPLFGNFKSKKKFWISPVNKEDKKLFNHPTIKPLHIIRTLIENSSNENDLILDPFIGVGTTGVACKLTDRNFIGFEIDRDYAHIAESRIKSTTEQFSFL